MPEIITKPSKTKRDLPKSKAIVKGFAEPLANLSPEVVGQFREAFRIPARYTDEMLLTYRDELRYFWGGPQSIERVDGVDMVGIDATSERLGQLHEFAERAAPHAERQEAICLYWIEQARKEGRFSGTGNQLGPMLLNWKEGKVSVNRACLPLVLAMMCAKSRKWLAYCQRKGCDRPYLIPRKSDQKYCSSCQAVVVKEQKKESALKLAEERGYW